MLLLLAPSKTLNFTSPAPEWARGESALFLESSQQVFAALSRLSDQELRQLYRASDAIVAQNRARLDAWQSHPGKPALWAYRGDAYKGMYADTLSESEVTWAQQHVLIMSGLYGALRPRDLIAPYRLEMAAKLQIGGRTLVEFWAERLQEYVDMHASGVVCCLASDEYARAVVRRTTARVVTPVFMDTKPSGKVGQVPIYSKMMRGVMARWIIQHTVDDPVRLVEFAAHGYAYSPDQSTPESPVFVREHMRPLVF